VERWWCWQKTLTDTSIHNRMQPNIPLILFDAWSVYPEPVVIEVRLQFSFPYQLCHCFALSYVYHCCQSTVQSNWSELVTVFLPNPLRMVITCVLIVSMQQMLPCRAGGDGCQYWKCRTDPNSGVCCFLSRIPFFWDAASLRNRILTSRGDIVFWSSKVEIFKMMP
jgi:hypothetical protein